jgi:thioesterase domain-containing protein
MAPEAASVGVLSANLERRLRSNDAAGPHQPRTLSVHDPDDPNVRSVEAIAAHLEAVRNLVNEAVARYVPCAYEGASALPRAHAPGAADDPTFGWGPIARGGLEIHAVPGYHASMISEPRVRALATELERCIARASANPSEAAAFG